MDSTSFSFQPDNDQLLNNHLWQFALQNSFPLPPSAFPTSNLPPDFLSNYHHCLASYHQSVNWDFGSNDLSQYPISPGGDGALPYPNIDQLDFTKVEDFSTLLPFDQPQHSDDSVNGSQTLIDTSSETSTPAELNSLTSSPNTERSLSPEIEPRRRKRKPSTASGKSRKSSSSSKSGSSNVDRIRERNRISAQRFRDKKKADAIDLELKTLKLSEQRDVLVREITDLQWQSILLQEQCLRQVMCGCDDMKKFFKNKTNLHEKLCQTELHCHS